MEEGIGLQEEIKIRMSKANSKEKEFHTTR